jgi:hypothetical protein
MISTPDIIGLSIVPFVVLVAVVITKVRFHYFEKRLDKMPPDEVARISYMSARLNSIAGAKHCPHCGRLLV